MSIINDDVVFRAAHALGITFDALYRKIYGIDWSLGGTRKAEYEDALLDWRRHGHIEPEVEAYCLTVLSQSGRVPRVANAGDEAQAAQAVLPLPHLPAHPMYRPNGPVSVLVGE
jgi:hypothetical protein